MSHSEASQSRQRGYKAARESGQRKDRFREPVHNSSNTGQEGNAAAVRAAAGQPRRRTALCRGRLSPARRLPPNAGPALRSAPPAWPPGRFLPAPGAAGGPGLTPRPGTAGRAQPGSAEPRGEKSRRRRDTAPSVRPPCPAPAAPRGSAATRCFGRGKKLRGRLPLGQSPAGARPHTALHCSVLRPRAAPRSPRAVPREAAAAAPALPQRRRCRLPPRCCLDSALRRAPKLRFPRPRSPTQC